MTPACSAAQEPRGPHIVVLSSLFPSDLQPGSGLFIRERMFRVGQRLPLCVVSPAPWFPVQGLLRRLRPGTRPGAPRFERQRGFDVWFPRFFSIPLVLRRLDGLTMALGALPRVLSLKRAGRLDILDAHFAYPDGYAASLLGRWLGVPVTVTLRGTEERHARDPVLRQRLAATFRHVQRVFTVSDSLRRVAVSVGASPEQTVVVGNGVDLARFYPLDRVEQRSRLGIPAAAQVLVTVGGLCERKGFHRVIELLPALAKAFPALHYLAVGGPSPEGDWTERLREQVVALGLQDRVHFTGPLPPDALRGYLSAADVFVLPTRNEGWANVLLEAMACGLPVVATDVGGNAEVVCRPELGVIVPFEDAPALQRAIDAALRHRWDRAALRRYAEANTWDRRVDQLESEFRALAPPAVGTATASAAR
jgi:teichuronic acid biosynthesis glycosyltransferase TuaC